ncbi:MAG: NUDIX domain-containing protein [Saprospiraceae bacterium]|nr:NUDIX domain-containing protein [Saprospiraceae bacterium]
MPGKKIATSINTGTTSSSHAISLKARVLLINEGRILLLKQTKLNGGNYTLIGGRVENHEMVKESLVREVLEEAGIVIKKGQLHLVHTLYKKRKIGGRIVLYFECEKYRGVPKNMEPDKFKSVSWHHLDSLPTPMSPTVQHVLKMIEKGVPYSEISL